jgi:vacuolar protein sorting-associated protein 13A/C
MKDPKAWWTFATNCALKDVKEKRRKWTGEYYTERRRDRLEYIKLYKLKLRGYEPAPRLAELERKYSYEDLL